MFIRVSSTMCGIVLIMGMIDLIVFTKKHKRKWHKKVTSVLYSSSFRYALQRQLWLQCMILCLLCFLMYFSFQVNASGQFCGLAEMIDRVDFEKNMGFWQQDKWSGYFPVKWHIIKDIPNSQLRHIILENNESKPVTNSRDTQEVYIT